MEKFVEIDLSRILTARVSERERSRLIEQLEPMIVGVAYGYTISEGDYEDLRQIARMALNDAVYSYEPEKNDSFTAYASCCMHNALRDAVRHDNRHKSQILSTALELSDRLGAGELSVEHTVIQKERVETVNRKIHTALSETERKVLLLYVDGLSYSQIAERLSVSVKTVDNALSRARQKLQ